MWHMEKKTRRHWFLGGVPSKCHFLFQIVRIQFAEDNITAGSGPPSSKLSIDLHFMVIHLLGSTERKRRWSVDTDARPGDRDINLGNSHSFPSCSPFCSVWCMTECSIRTFYSGYWCVWVGGYGFPEMWKGRWVVPEGHHLHTGWRTADNNYPPQPNRPRHREAPRPPGHCSQCSRLNLSHKLWQRRDNGCHF